jgi:NAD(P)H-hydrate repair Nnr-like enzyme with NAD(P)H-hydrate dehydratase domain
VGHPSRIEPDEVDQALEHRLAAAPELANRVLRVIVSKGEPRRVITAHLDRKMKGKL